MGNTVKISTASIAHNKLVLSINSEKKDERRNVIQMDEGASLDDIVKALNKLGATADDVVAVIKSLKAVGAIHSEITVI